MSFKIALQTFNDRGNIDDPRHVTFNFTDCSDTWGKAHCSVGNISGQLEDANFSGFWSHSLYIIVCM